MPYEKIAFFASPTPDAQQALQQLQEIYHHTHPDEADVLVALGGDGLMLSTLHQFMSRNVPIYGMNRGSVGFLMNEYSPDGLIERLNQAEAANIHPLRMIVIDKDGQKHAALAINEVSLLRSSYQAAKLKINIDGRTRLAELVSDGVLVATPAGSTAYNFSAQGPIVPINSPILALTPISPFRPRRWRGALLSDQARIHIEVLEAEQRPVSAVADFHEVRDIKTIDIVMDPTVSIKMLFDDGHNMEERILREQFDT